jgi:transposase-like protein
VRIRHEADERIARASVRTAVTTAARLAFEMAKLPLIENVIRTARETNNEAMAAQMERRREDIQGNINTDMSVYYDTLSSIMTLNKDIVDTAFSLHNVYLQEPSRKEAARLPLQVIGLAKAHYEQYFRDKRGNTEAWRKNFSEVQGVVAQD